MIEHASDRDLLLEIDGELAAADRARVRRHLSLCRACRARRSAIERAMACAAAIHRGEPVAAAPEKPWAPAAAAAALAACAALLAVAFLTPRPERPEQATPDRELTPGVATGAAVCGASSEPPAIAAATAGEVFRRYGVRNPRPGEFEVDYLIPPDLGGAAEPRNLWPQPYARGVWNSRVKDALEDRLRGRVCAGEMALRDAQREIAEDWIGAYRRHFNARQPLYEHASFVKDPAWE